MQLGISEIFDKIDAQEDRAIRQNMLAGCSQNQGVMSILKLAYDPNIVFNLPAGTPPYKPCQYGDQQSMLYQSLRKMYLFIGEGNPNINQLKRETLFINMIEALDPADAKLILSVKDKKLPYTNIDEDLVRDTFPELLPPKVVVEKQEIEASQKKLIVKPTPNTSQKKPIVKTSLNTQKTKTPA